MTWDLPKDRTLSYDTEMTLTKKDKDWQVRLRNLCHVDGGLDAAVDALLLEEVL